MPLFSRIERNAAKCFARAHLLGRIDRRLDRPELAAVDEAPPGDVADRLHDVGQVGVVEVEVDEVVVALRLEVDLLRAIFTLAIGSPSVTGVVVPVAGVDGARRLGGAGGGAGGVVGAAFVSGFASASSLSCRVVWLRSASCGPASAGSAARRRRLRDCAFRHRGGEERDEWRANQRGLKRSRRLHACWCASRPRVRAFKPRLGGLLGLRSHREERASPLVPSGSFIGRELHSLTGDATERPRGRADVPPGNGRRVASGFLRLSVWPLLASVEETEVPVFAGGTMPFTTDTSTKLAMATNAIEPTTNVAT